MGDSRKPHRVDLPTLADTAPRLIAMRDQHARHTRTAWIGELVMSFTNDELRLLADHYLSAADVADLRRLGLLRPDEGFDPVRRSS